MNCLTCFRFLAELKSRLSSDEYRQCFLVIAGGFDKLNEENLLYHHELKEYAVDAAISTKQILFLRSPGTFFVCPL